MNREIISDILCDLYDIRHMAQLEGFGNLPKDNEGTETTIFDCLQNCIDHLEVEAYQSISDNDTFIDINNTGGKY